MNKLIASLCLASGIFCLSLSAQAATYFGIDVGSGITNESKNIYDVHAGYRIGNLVGAEVGYSQINDTKLNNNAKRDVKFFHASGLVYLPIPLLVLDIYGRFGIGYSKLGSSESISMNSDSKVGTFFGIGTEFNWIPFVSIRAEIQHMPSIAGGSKPTIFKLGGNIKF